MVERPITKQDLKSLEFLLKIANYELKSPRYEHSNTISVEIRPITEKTFRCQIKAELYNDTIESYFMEDKLDLFSTFQYFEQFAKSDLKYHIWDDSHLFAQE